MGFDLATAADFMWPWSMGGARAIAAGTPRSRAIRFFLLAHPPTPCFPVYAVAGHSRKAK